MSALYQEMPWCQDIRICKKKSGDADECEDVFMALEKDLKRRGLS